jgi:hypothetical protein
MKNLFPFFFVWGLSTFFINSAYALSCSFYDELSMPTRLAQETNIIEAKIMKISSNKEGVGLTFDLETKEVYRGTRLPTFTLYDGYAAGSPSVTKEKYQKLLNKNVVLLGDAKFSLCTDGIIEIEKVAKPELLRAFLRCLEPAIKLSEAIKINKDFLKGLPGQFCYSPRYGNAYSSHIDGMCGPNDYRRSWLEEFAGGGFLNPVEVAINILCPNPNSAK